ncbi:MAG: holo-ACP synthase [Chlorobiaceae bacterium]|nr:holo-ACP synthase [Chlorobiaceae bacterium]NTW62767.1 holo-ACP synthase [Chlorobiaceae bacterium]
MAIVQEIGMDIINVDRIRTSCNRYGDRFLMKILTENEIALCRKKADMTQSVAARFAAKEALSKALGCGISKHFNWHSVEILNNPEGKPFVRVIDKQSPLSEASISISLSHDKQYATAVVLVS